MMLTIIMAMINDDVRGYDDCVNNANNNNNNHHCKTQPHFQGLFGHERGKDKRPWKNTLEDSKILESYRMRSGKLCLRKPSGFHLPEIIKYLFYGINCEPKEIGLSQQCMQRKNSKKLGIFQRILPRYFLLAEKDHDQKDPGNDVV